MHAIKGRVTVGDALSAKSTNTVSDDSLKFAVKDGGFNANSVTILKAGTPP